MIGIAKPKESWKTFVERQPKGKSIEMRTIFDRWATKEPKNGLSKADGERNAYMAWLLGVMSEEEAQCFGMMTLNSEALVRLAVVPVVRELLKEHEYLRNIIGELTAQIAELRAVQA